MIIKRLKTYLPLILLLSFVAVLTAGCSGSSLTAGTSWPGITAFDDTAYVAYGSKVYAMDIETGDARWSFPEKAVNGQTFFAPPAATDDLVIVTDYRDSALALDPSDGQQLWAFKSNNSRFIGGAAIGEKYGYVATVAGVVYALDRKTGSEVWSYDTKGSVWSTPLLADGVLYITSLDHHLYGVDAETGKLTWEFSGAEGIPADAPPVGAMVGTPTLYDGVLYFGSFSNRVYAVSVETRKILWTYDTTNWVWSSPVIVEQDKQLIGADLDGHVFALNLQDGSPVWTYEASGPVVGAPLIGEMDGTPVVYLVCGDEPNLIVLNASDGAEAIKPATIKADFPDMILFFKTGTSTRSIPIFASPVQTDKLLVIGAHEGNDILYILDNQTLQEEWRFSPTAYEEKQQEEQGQESQSFLSNPMNIILLIAITFLMATMMGRGRKQK